MTDGPPFEGDIWRETIEAFAKLWDSINAKRGYGWDVNPGIYALTFEVVK